MSNLSKCAFLIIASAISATPAYAQSLVGTQVTVNRVVDAPTYQWEWGAFAVTVTEGPSDIFSLSGFPNLFVDIDSSSILFDFGTGGGGGPWAMTEHYVSFEGFSFQPEAILTGVAITTNVPGLTLGNLDFGPNSLRFNYGGLSTPENTFLKIQLITTVVPEPSPWLLFPVGAALLMLRRDSRRPVAAV